MKKKLLFLLLFLIVIFNNNINSIINIPEKLTKLNNTIFIVRKDYILGHPLNKQNTQNSYKFNQTYNEIIRKLIEKKIEKKEVNIWTRAKIIILQEINRQLKNIINQNSKVKNYKPHVTTQLNWYYYSKEDKNFFDSIVTKNLEQVIKNSITELNIDKFNLIQVTWISPTKWQFNQNTFLVFNNYLYILELLGIYLLFKDKPEFFLKESELKNKELSKIFAHRKKDILELLIAKLEKLNLPKDILNNLIDQIQKELKFLSIKRVALSCFVI